MCISCGCGMPTTGIITRASITIDDLEEGGAAAGMSTEEAAENIADAVGLSCNKGS